MPVAPSLREIASLFSADEQPVKGTWHLPPAVEEDRGEDGWLPIATAEPARVAGEKCQVKDETGAIHKAAMYGEPVKIVVYGKLCGARLTHWRRT